MLIICSEKTCDRPEGSAQSIPHCGREHRLDGSQQLIEMIASQGKTLHLVEGGYHALLDDTNRNHTLAVLLMWLERRLPPNRE